VSAKCNITMQLIITQFLITSFSIFFTFSQTAIFLQQLLSILYFLGTPFFFCLFLVSAVLYISLLHPNLEASCSLMPLLQFPNSVSSHHMQLSLYLQQTDIVTVQVVLSHLNYRHTFCIEYWFIIVIIDLFCLSVVIRTWHTNLCPQHPIVISSSIEF